MVGGVLRLERDGLLHLEGRLPPELAAAVVNRPRAEADVHLHVLKAERDINLLSSELQHPFPPGHICLALKETMVCLQKMGGARCKLSIQLSAQK